MKKSTLLACLTLSLLAPLARATITFTTTPPGQSVAAGSSFDVTLSLSVTQNTAPANVDGFDLYLATAASNSGYFAITAATATGAFTSSVSTGIPSGGDMLNNAASAGYVRNGVDQGFIDANGTNAQATPLTGYSLEQLTLSIAAGTPAGTYKFSTTTTANAGTTYYSDVTDSGGTIYPADVAGTFQITVVPEPTTNALLAAGAALAGLGWYLQRARRTAPSM